MAEFWAIQWHSKNRLDGETKFFMYDKGRPLLFDTRREARDYIRKEYAYIMHRPDLRAEHTHGWRVPKAIKVKLLFVPV